MRGELRRAVPLLVLFGAGLAAGVWVFVSPWALGYPAAGAAWSASTWTSVWSGAAVIAASAISLVAVLARGVHATLRRTRPGEA
ncbi:MAG TPA: hypothetical protein VOB72_10835 [Candidatus Dormibacteraeota bacterium]|nr:hypothetical protein [Candidatus Dormibacteraeota bacterium]